MLGLDGVAVPLGFALTLLSAALCIGYGVKNWDKGHVTSEELSKEELWNEEEGRVEKTL